MAEPTKKVTVQTAAENKKAVKLSPRERFKKYAERRVSKCLKAMRHVQNMANIANYEYTPQEAQQIVDALIRTVKLVQDAFAGQKEAKSDFRLF